MCGITGIVNLNKKRVSPDVIKDMTQAISHRGPDDEGIYIDGNIALGQRRLAIIDLSSAGHQPMFNEDKSIALVFNGEIYNFESIKQMLEKRGHKFFSHSDTEVIIHAYEEYGEACVEKFNGMWAFAIYDQRKKKIFISRDRYGIKPLYYLFDHEKFIFASEIKALLRYPGVKTKLDFEALNEYFTFQNLCSDLTLFVGIYLLPAAHNLFFDGQNLKKERYWDANFTKIEYSPEEWENKLVKTLKESISRHLIADVPVGVLLSGGMDSGTISYFASKKVPHMVTFTGGFDFTKAVETEAFLDERGEAEKIARLFSQEHYEDLLYPESPGLVIRDLIWHLEDLRLGMSYPQFYLAKLSSKFVKVALSGTGGDEILGGYPWRYDIIKNVKNPAQFDDLYYNYWSRLVKDNQKDQFFSKNILKKIDLERPFQEYRKLISAADNFRPVDKAMYFEQKTFLHGFLIVEDKLFMAHSMEVRVPYTDLEMAKLLNSMPDKLKFNRRWGKYFFRKVMSKFLPKETVFKKKTGFTPPERTWYQQGRMNYIKDTILGKQALSRGYFQREYIEKIWQESISGRKDQRLLLWSLYSFEWWCRIFLDGEGKRS